MQNLRKVYEKQVQTTGLHKEIEKAREVFEVKPFVSEFLKLKHLVVVLRPSLSLFSIVTGFGFLFYQFASYLNLYVAVVLALVLLVGIELVKSELSTLAFKRAYIKTNALSFVLALFALAFFALSVFLSVNGAKEIYKQLDNKTNDFKALHQTKIDSIHQHYDKLLASEKEALAAFKNSVSWQGKININDKTVASTLASYQKRIDDLLAEKANARSVLEQASNKALITIEQKTGFEVEFWFWLSLGVELAILLCLWFLVFFAYHTSKESTIFDASPEATFQHNLQDFLSVVSLDAKTYTSPQILATSLDAHSPINGQDLAQEKLRDFKRKGDFGQSLVGDKSSLTLSEKRQRVIQDLRQGIVDCRVLTRRHGVSVVVVNECKEELRKIQDE